MSGWYNVQIHVLPSVLLQIDICYTYLLYINSTIIPWGLNAFASHSFQWWRINPYILLCLWVILLKKQGCTGISHPQWTYRVFLFTFMTTLLVAYYAITPTTFLQVVIMLVFLVVLFFLCWTPRSIELIYMILYRKGSQSTRNLITTITKSITLINSMINPIIYAKTSP